jgi:NitT/TauT family transport system substrate-binding protein
MTLHRGDFIKMAGLASLGGAVSATGTAAADDLKSARAISVPTDAAKQILYAQKANLFRKHGVQIDLSAMGSGAAIFAAIVGGSCDFGSGSLFPVFQAYGRGIPLRIIAPISIYDTDHCDAWLLVAKDAAIHAPRDLNGKIMGADAATDIYVSSTRVWLDNHGGDGKSLRPVELKATEQLAALNAGRIDVVALKPPYLTVAMQSGKVRVLGKPLDVIAPRFLLSCWVSSTDYIAKNPETLKGFVAALTEASVYCNKHQADTIDIVAQFSSQDPALLREGVRSTLAESISLADVQKPLDFAFKYGVIDKQYDAKLLLAPVVPMTRGRNV